MSKPKVYKRRVYLINPRFQLRTSLFTASLAFIASLPYPYIIYWIINNYFEKMEGGNLGSNVTEMANSFDPNRRGLILFLVGWQLGFCLFVFILGVYQSHKIAGPIYKVRNLLKEIIAGNLPDRIKFRNGDHFPELAEDLTTALSALREKKTKDYLYVEEVEKFLEEVSSQISPESREKLKSLSQKIHQMKLSVSK